MRLEEGNEGNLRVISFLIRVVEMGHNTVILLLVLVLAKTG